MILYQSTRGYRKRYNFSQVVLKGIASDGGLFVPIKFPKISENKLKSLAGISYQNLCFEIFRLFQTGLSPTLLRKITSKAYSKNFDSPKIAPLIHLKDHQYILELWHGPTSAFKDIALQIMPLFFSEAAKILPSRYLILVATSGDTGKAAMEGFKDKEGVKIIVFYPIDKVSELQKLQMITQEGANLEVVGMKGNFDEVQKSIKEVFKDHAFSQKLLEDYNTVLSSANSINWGRLLPQMIYHFSSYLDLVMKKIIKLGQEIDIAVPTGNFGNILAAFYAKKMGLPIRKLICTSNENNVLTRFLQTGIYDIRDKNLINTPSPSMNIIIANNIERLLFELTEDSSKILGWMKQLENKKKFETDKKTKKDLKSIFHADWVSNKDSLFTIAKVYNEINYLIDPHTSVACTVADRFQTKYGSNVPMIICSTAHWAKFPKDIYKVLNGSTKDEDEFAIIQRIKKMDPQLHIPKNILDLKKKKILHRKIISVTKDKIEKEILQYLSR